MTWHIKSWKVQEPGTPSVAMYPRCCCCDVLIEDVADLQILLASLNDEHDFTVSGTVVFLHTWCRNDYLRDPQVKDLTDAFLTEDERRAGQPLPEVSLARFALMVFRWAVEPKLEQSRKKVGVILDTLENMEQLTGSSGKSLNKKGIVV